MKIFKIGSVACVLTLVFTACSEDRDLCVPSTEVCDNLDNDCNGAVDDGVAAKACQTVCGTGTEQCVEGQWTACSAGEPAAESCNGIDDDCDGCTDEMTDEGCAPLEQACATDCGVGSEFCVAGEWRGCTVPEPVDEVCDDLDNDCDGLTDEELDTDADGDGYNAAGSCHDPSDCHDGNAEVYPGHPEAPGYCDGVDNDCDHEIDEDCECDPGDTQTCSSNVGECTEGSQTCQPDASWGPCSGTTPAEEICDDRDNDCDAETDNAVPPRACQTACGFGFETCAAGAWIDCDAPQPQAESCNGLDDDCDGCWDEKPGDDCLPLERPCTTPCGVGVEFCLLGEWRDCTVADPDDEICDGIDNDCDGETDEDLDIDTDADGYLSPDSCSQPADDCNDSNPEVHPGHQESPGFCDGLDNDCDDEIDEDCECSTGQTQTCSTNVGECRVGSQACENDGTWGACDGVLPADEVCDQKDNDCDGVTDNVAVPPPCELTEGICAGAVSTGCEPCDYGPDYEAGAELSCDDLDNDCDGETDESLPHDTFEPNELCTAAAGLGTMEEGTGLTLDATLYAYWQGVPVDDTDWYDVTLEEDFHFCQPPDPQCFQFHAFATLPPGADHTGWEMCILEHTGGSCTDTGTQLCTQDSDWHPGSNGYHLGVQWDGICGIPDDREFAVVVRSMSEVFVLDCSGYELELIYAYAGSQTCR